jgi:hypothetical protein
MSEHDFQTEILSRLGSIESKQDIMYEELRSLQGDVKNSASVANDALNSTKSAHKRIDGIKTDAMTLGAVISFCITIILKLFEK